MHKAITKLVCEFCYKKTATKKAGNKLINEGIGVYVCDNCVDKL